MDIIMASYVYPHPKDPRLGMFVHEQAREFVRQGHSVKILTSGSDKTIWEARDDLRIRRIPSRGLRRFTYNLQLFLELLKIAKKGDIIHLHFVGVSAVACRLAAFLKGTPFVATAHGIDVCWGNRRQRRLMKFFMRFPQRVVCVSRFTRDLAADLAPKEKLEVINNGVDTTKLVPKGKAAVLRKKHGLEGKKILLSVGGLVERKGHEEVIRALPRIAEEVPEVFYIIIGKGALEKRLKALAKELGVSGRTLFLRYVDDKELPDYFDLCDIFILMSKTIKERSGVEGFGIVFIEAGYLGKPVIGGKSGGTGDAIIDGKTGYRIDPEDTAGLVSKTSALLKDEKLQKKMGEAARERVSKGFLWKHNVEKLVKLYVRLRKSIS